ncbi:MAG: ABC transporter ATP-binding protein [Pseudomonadota bacterium]
MQAEIVEKMLEVDDLRVAYNRVIRVLEGISLTVPKGNVVALLGTNGSGKSTTVKAISGMLRSDNGTIVTGRVVLEGEDVTRKGAPAMVRRGVMHVMEGRFVFPDLTVKENLLMGAYSLKDRSGINEDIRHWLGFFPILSARTNTQAGYLSGGEQQMLVIARALMAHPRVILLDEPSMGLSPLLVREVFRIIADIREAHQLTFLLVEQNVRMALQVADFGYVIERGSIRLEGTAEELRQNKHLQDFYLGISENGNQV